MINTQLSFFIILLFCSLTSPKASEHGLRGRAVEVTANDDFAQLYENQSSVIFILDNDFGLYVGVESLEIVEEPQFGTATIQEDNTILYKPDLSFFGDDQLVYKVCNTDGSCDEAVVYIKVNDVDFKPVAVNDTIEYLHGTEVSVPILENDTILGDFPISVDIRIDFNHAEAYLDEGDNLVPTFKRAFGGVDSLQYEICDADGDCSLAWVFAHVKHDGSSDFYIPNAFSPNGDGFNDTFYIPDFNTYSNINVNIFSEWGQLIFQSSDYQNDWNGEGNAGRMKGKVLDSGTYYYVFKIKGVESTLTGYVYLSR